MLSMLAAATLVAMSTVPCPGDINESGSVDGEDLLMLLGAWGPCENCAACSADLNSDCHVDGTDLLILLGNWGECEEPGWFSGEWQHRRKITIDHTNVANDLADFPVLITLSGDTHAADHSRADGHDIVFTAADGVTKLSHNRVTHTRRVDDVTWYWFQYPIAAHRDGVTYIGWITNSGDVKVGSYDHAEGVFNVGTVEENWEISDHNIPSIHIREDGRIIAFYAEHIGDLVYRISTNPGDVSSWQPRVDVETGDDRGIYPKPLTLAGDGLLYHYYRYIDDTAQRIESFRTSEDDGDSWSERTSLFLNDGERAYVLTASNGNDRVHFAASTGHPADVDLNHLYHFYMELDDGGRKYYTSDGTLIGDDSILPLTPADVTPIYIDTGDNGWQWDITLDDDGNPIVLFTTFPNVTTDHRMQYARWNGSEWVIHEIGSMGPGIARSNERYYSGGGVIDPEDTNVVYLSQMADNGTRQIFRHTTSDGGETWVADPITHDQGLKNFRPIIPRTPHPDMRLLWLHGHYLHYRNPLLESGLRTSSNLGEDFLGEYYVRIPSLSVSEPTEIYVYYGNADASDQADGEAFDENYMIAARGDLHRSDFGAIDLASKSQLTVEARVTMKFATAGRQFIASNWFGNRANFMLLKRDSPTHELRMLLRVVNDGQIAQTFHDLQLAEDTWHWIDMLYSTVGGEGGTMRLDGVLSEHMLATSNVLHGTPSPNPLQAGQAPHAGPSDQFNGIVETLKISDIKRSTDWLDTARANETDPQSFAQVGAVESQSVASDQPDPGSRSASRQSTLSQDE